MLRVGLSGGIGSGKSTVAALLAERGAVVVDADQVAREVVEPGTRVLSEIVDRFGPAVIDSEGRLKRAALGQRVFSDDAARRDLEAITHPAIVARSTELIEQALADAVVVHDLPLLVELDRAAHYALTVIVDVSHSERIQRLVQQRGLDPDQAQARMAAQASDEQRRAAADVLIDNSGSLASLTAQVDELWHRRLALFEQNMRAKRPSRPPEKLTICEPWPAWSADAARLLARLRYGFGEYAVSADHIGSTSIPGLVAKDVIDLQIGVSNLAVLDLPEVRSRLAQVGFLPMPGGPWYDHDHDRGPGTTAQQTPKELLGTGDPARVVHAHVRVAESGPWRRALLFRDWLLNDPAAREQYQLLKIDLAGAGLSTSEYAAAKEPWFAQAFAEAQRWGKRSGWAQLRTACVRPHP